MQTQSQLMTKPELVDNMFRLVARIKKMRALGCEDLARLDEAEAEVLADRLGWN